MPKPKTPKPEYKLLPADPDADYPKAPKRCVWTPNGLELRKVEPEPEPEKD